MHLQQQSSASAYSCVGSNSNTSTSDHERTYAASAFPLSSYSSSTHTFISGSSGIKAMFTASQWQELERQKMIHQYMMASVPVPPQLLSSLHTAPSLPHVSQSSNILGLNLDLRFSSSSGSDPEPWRCKRTDGKKWRCSRDVAPDQKYCERHAHKSRSRSRKHVEVQTSSPNNTSSSPNSTTYSSRHQQQAIVFPFHNSTSNANTTGYPTMASSATSYDQTRCIEWFTKGDSKSSNSRKSNPDSSRNNKQQRQRLIKTASSSSTIITDNPNKKVPPLLYHHHGQPQNDDNDKDLPLGFVSLMNSYNSIPDHTSSHLHQISLGTHESITRHFIDAWENEGKKFNQSSSSLSLSVSSGGNGITNDQDSDLNIGMVKSDRDSVGISRTSQQWLSNPAVSWMNINYSQPPPGGPLGEALCLGNSNSHVARCDSNTNSGSCSKSSCEDGSHGLHFTG